MRLSYLVTCVILYCSFYLDKKNSERKEKKKDIKVKSTQVNFCNFWQETYYTENTESRETERGETKKLSTETEKKTNWALIKAYKKEEVIFEERRQKHLDALSRS